MMHKSIKSLFPETLSGRVLGSIKGPEQTTWGEIYTDQYLVLVGAPDGTLWFTYVSWDKPTPGEQVEVTMSIEINT